MPWGGLPLTDSGYGIPRCPRRFGRKRPFGRMGIFWDNQSGMALVVTLGVISLLLAAGIGVSCFVGKRILTTEQDRDLYQAEQWALSGIHFAMMVLAEDGKNTRVDSVQEFWADEQKMTDAANAVLGTKDRISLCVTDELSRVQVNALIREFPGRVVNPDQVEILEALFSQILANAPEDLAEKDLPTPMALVNAIIDWLDSGDDDTITGLSGAESTYYQGLEPPYSCANLALSRLDEICNIKGMDCSLLGKLLKIKDSSQGLENLLTVHGLALGESGKGVGKASGSSRFSYPGTININTAPFPVLAALMPRGMENMAQDLVDFRKETTESGDVFVNFLDKGWYKKVIALSEKEQKKLDRKITYASHIFRVESSAKNHKARVRLTAFVRRYPMDGNGKRNKGRGAGAGKCRILAIQRDAEIPGAGGFSAMGKKR